MESTKQLKFTGDIFIDVGNQVLRYLKTKMSTSDSIEYLIDRYLGDWNKAVYSFFPNSFFLQPQMSNDEKKSRAKKIYIDGDYEESYRDKVILTGSKSLANFYPGAHPEKSSIYDIRAHLAVPLASFMIKHDNLYSIITCPPYWLYMLTKRVVKKNMELSGPVRLEHDKWDFLVDLFSEFTDHKFFINLMRFSNYGMNPECHPETVGHNQIKKAMLKFIHSDIGVQELREAYGKKKNEKLTSVVGGKVFK